MRHSPKLLYLCQRFITARKFLLNTLNTLYLSMTFFGERMCLMESQGKGSGEIRIGFGWTVMASRYPGSERRRSPDYVSLMIIRRRTEFVFVLGSFFALCIYRRSYSQSLFIVFGSLFI